MSRLLLRSIAASLLLSPLFGACRPDAPEQPRTVDTAVSTPVTPQAPPAAAAPSAPAAAPAASGYWAEPATQGDTVRTSARQQVVGTLESFFGTITAGDEAAFRGRLSARSMQVVRDLGAEEEIWSIARDALGSIEGRSVRFLGGTPDSAALLVSGHRSTGDTSLPAQIVLSVVREGGAWKVMYPGAQPYQEHVGP